MINLLVLTAGTNACYHIIKVLKEKFSKDFYIVGADINDCYLLPVCGYIDKYYKVPTSAEGHYYDIIINICKKEKINYILPDFDIDQKLFYTENPDLRRLGIKSFGISEEILDIYKDKISINNFLKLNNFKIPNIIDINDVETDMSYFIKPIDGVGSKNARIINGSQLINQYGKDIIIQEKCNYPEITLECFNYQNELRTIARERIATKSGICTKARIYIDNELHQIAQNFVSCIKAPYYFNLQFMKNSFNQYVITDVNLRFAGGMSLSYAAEWDVVSAIANIMLGKSKKEILKFLPDTIQTQYVVRAYTDIVTKVEKVTIAFDLDGTLLDSTLRHKILLDDLLKEYDISINTDNLLDYKRQGKNNEEYLQKNGVNINIATEIQKKWIEHIEDEKYLNYDVLYSYTIELLETYKNYDLILITSRRKKERVFKQLKKFDIEKYFKKIYVISNSKIAKNEKSRILKEENAKCMYGDSEIDFFACKNAQIEFKPVYEGFRSKQFLQKLK